MAALDAAGAVQAALNKLKLQSIHGEAWAGKGCSPACQVCQQAGHSRGEAGGLWSQNEALYFDFDELDDIDEADNDSSELSLASTSPSPAPVRRACDASVRLRLVAAVTGALLCTLPGIQRSCTVRDLKDHIERVEGTQASMQLLLFGERIPQDADMLSGLLTEADLIFEVKLIRSAPVATGLLESLLSGEVSLQDLDETARADRILVLAAVRASQGRALEHASQQLRGDKHVVLEAVSRNGLSLRHATPAMRFDRAVVLAAIRECPLALEHAHDSLRHDHDIILTAVRLSVRAVECIADEMKRNTDFACEVIAAFPAALLYLPTQITGSRSMLLKVLRRNGDALRFAIGWHRDPEMALTAIQQAPQAVHHVDSELRQKTTFAEAAIAVNPWVVELWLTEAEASSQGWGKILAIPA
eukprot:TRINITY_DN6731_c0_g1_i2.p1 TRINITY_DN6731_c0_g1~~TRINITY_DN6731_c0_g1_i2.p1  ORF type:complete len:446 (+),score=89.60 TRINITY_DN6731_c0_g1_i2:93-1340(+)